MPRKDYEMIESMNALIRKGHELAYKYHDHEGAARCYRESLDISYDAIVNRWAMEQDALAKRSNDNHE